MNSFQVLDKTVKIDFSTPDIQEKFDLLLVTSKLQGYRLTTNSSDGDKFTVDGKRYSFCPFTQIIIENEEKTCTVNFMLNDDKNVNYVMIIAGLVETGLGVSIKDSNTEETFNKALDQLIQYL